MGTILGGARYWGSPRKEETETGGRSAGRTLVPTGMKVIALYLGTSKTGSEDRWLCILNAEDGKELGRRTYFVLIYSLNQSPERTVRSGMRERGSKKERGEEKRNLNKKTRGSRQEGLKEDTRWGGTSGNS